MWRDVQGSCLKARVAHARARLRRRQSQSQRDQLPVLHSPRAKPSHGVPALSHGPLCVPLVHLSRSCLGVVIHDVVTKRMFGLTHPAWSDT